MSEKKIGESADKLLEAEMIKEAKMIEESLTGMKMWRNPTSSS